MALIESPIFEDGIIYREWIEDEIVIFSNQKIPRRLTDEDLKSFKWICRNRDSHTRLLFKEALDNSSMSDCDTFNMISEATSPTTIVQTVLHSDKTDVPTVSIVSRNAIDDLVKAGVLFEGRIGHTKIMRKLYIAYLKEKKYDAFVENVVNYLISKK
jgi:DNA-binding transcriptional LysR family regulator